MRLIILCLLIYLGYKVVKAFISPSTPLRTPETRSDTQSDLKRERGIQIDDVMIKDPVCETYIPKKDAIKETVNGETLFFCSTTCRDKYLDNLRKKHENV